MHKNDVNHRHTNIDGFALGTRIPPFIDLECFYIYIYICVCVCMYIYIYIYIYTGMHTNYINTCVKHSIKY